MEEFGGAILVEIIRLVDPDNLGVRSEADLVIGYRERAVDRNRLSEIVVEKTRSLHRIIEPLAFVQLCKLWNFSKDNRPFNGVSDVRP